MQNPNDLVLPELSYRVIGCFYEVHRILRSGLLESSYQEALAIELQLCGIACQREVPVALKYKGQRIHGFKLDLVVEEKIVIECKTTDSLHPSHLVQLRNYLRVSGIPLGMVLLFGTNATFQRVTAGVSQARASRADLCSPGF